MTTHCDKCHGTGTVANTGSRSDGMPCPCVKHQRVIKIRSDITKEQELIQGLIQLVEQYNILPPHGNTAYKLAKLYMEDDNNFPILRKTKEDLEEWSRKAERERFHAEEGQRIASNNACLKRKAR